MRYFAGCVALLLVVLFGVWTSASLLSGGSVRGLATWEPQGPRSIEDVECVAKALGLHGHTDSMVGGHFRMVISEERLGAEDIAELHIGPTLQPNWAGRVAVYFGFSKSDMAANFIPGCTAVWGDTLLFGDPSLIRRLLESDPTKR